MSLKEFAPGPAVDVLHGITVIDPYRWLENRTLPATETWIQEQRQRRDAYFADIPQLDWLRRRVSDHLNVEVVDQPTRVGNLYFYRRRKMDQEQACLYVKDIATSVERLLVDPVMQGRFAAVAIHHISYDGSLLAYELRHGGSDATTIHVVSVKDSFTLPEYLDIGRPRGFSFAEDNSGFYYCHEASVATGPHQIRFHLFGQSMTKDEPILSIDRTAQSRLVLISDERRICAVIFHSQSNDSLVDFYLMIPERTTGKLRGLGIRNVPYRPFLKCGRIFAVASEATSNKHIIELTELGNPYRTIVPPWDYRIQRLVVVGRVIFISYLVDRKTVVRRWTFDGEYLGPLDLPDKGSAELLHCASNGADALFYSCESFNEAPKIFEYRPDTNTAGLWASRSADTAPFPVQEREAWFPSRDGVAIPISLVMKSEKDLNQVSHALLTSYGGFGVSASPQFSVLVTIMLELGAVFALPCIRGGSEFGNAWHEAAKGRNRQVAFDDFLASADWLCSQGITKPEMLAIFGGSNSGLLVAAAMTQRPNLFRAVMCIAPLLDMLRYEIFDNARKWASEFGTVDEPEDFAALYRYSPYHRIIEDVDYPAILFVSGDCDDRCNPAHVRKMAARLQDRPAQRNAVLVDYAAERGHAPCLPLSVRIEALVRRIAFLCSELGIQLPVGGRP